VSGARAEGAPARASSSGRPLGYARPPQLAPHEHASPQEQLPAQVHALPQAQLGPHAQSGPHAQAAGRAAVSVFEGFVERQAHVLAFMVSVLLSAGRVVAPRSTA
jgi:hypothetical protein